MISSFHILGREISIYGLMAATGIICGLLFIALRTRKLKLDIEYAFYMYMFGVIGAGVGAKILFLLLNISNIQRDLKIYGLLKTTIGYIQGGLVFYGGLIGAILAAFLTAKLNKLDIKSYYPSLVPGIAILAGFGRIGCLIQGCCYGAPTISRIHIIYPEGVNALSGVPLVPVQAYEMLFDFLMVVVLTVLSFKKPTLNPHLLKIYLVSYALMRFVLEFWRGDLERGIKGPFSTSQWISIVIILVVLGYVLLNTKNKQMSVDKN